MVNTLFQVAGTFTAQQGRQLQTVGFAGATATRPLGAFSGVRPGTPSNTVTATTTTVTVQPFAGFADVQASGSNGGYEFVCDAVQSFSLAAQSASIPRSDIVYVQINDTVVDGSGFTSAAAVYLAGSTVTIPSLPNSRAFIIAVINVPIVGSSPTVTWVAPYAVAAGGVLPFNTDTQMRAVTPGDGQLAYVYATGQVFSYEATATTPGWYHVGGRPTLDVVTFAGIYSSSGTSPVKAVTLAGRVSLEGIVISTSATFVSGTTYTLGTIPAALAPLTPQVFACSANATALGAVQVDASGNVTMVLNSGFTGLLALSLSGSWRLKGL